MLTCPRSSLSFHSNAHHHGSLPQQLGVVWDLLLKADPEGPSPIFHAALRHRFHTHTGTALHVSLQHTVSRPAEFHHRPLAEPSVRLSPHSAPIRQTFRSYRSPSVQRGSPSPPPPSPAPPPPP